MIELSQTLREGFRPLSAQCCPEYPALLRQGGTISIQHKDDCEIVHIVPPRLVNDISLGDTTEDETPKTAEEEAGEVPETRSAEIETEQPSPLLQAATT